MASVEIRSAVCGVGSRDLEALKDWNSGPHPTIRSSLACLSNTGAVGTRNALVYGLGAMLDLGLTDRAGRMLFALDEFLESHPELADLDDTAGDPATEHPRDREGEAQG